MTEQTRVEDHSDDRQYFTMVPRIVHTRCTDVYQLSLWFTIKSIAGEAGECYLATPDLAALAMMSSGKASEARQQLLDAGLLTGELRRDPGYPHAVWHLKIPNLWRINLQQAEDMPSLKDRIAHKAWQKESLHLVKASPGENILSPGENILPPGETKKIHVVNPEGDPLPPTAEIHTATAFDRATHIQPLAPTWSKHEPRKEMTITIVPCEPGANTNLQLIKQRDAESSGDPILDIISQVRSEDALSFQGSFFSVDPPGATAVEVFELYTDPGDTSITCPCDQVNEWPPGQDRRRKAPALTCSGCSGLFIVHGYAKGDESRPQTYRHPNIPEATWTVTFAGFGPGLHNIPTGVQDARKLWNCDKRDAGRLQDKVRWVAEQKLWRVWPKTSIVARIVKAWETSSDNTAVRKLVVQTEDDDYDDW